MRAEKISLKVVDVAFEKKPQPLIKETVISFKTNVLVLYILETSEIFNHF